MDEILNVVIPLILLVVSIILYILYRDSTEKFEDRITKKNIDTLTLLNFDSFSDFKYKFPDGDAIIYKNLLDLKLNNNYTRSNIKEAYLNWV